MYRWLLTGLFLTFGGIAAATAPGSASKAAPHLCGGVAASRDVAQPPDVQMWKAPVDAQGLHELILAVHRDGDRFCYRYSWNGAVQTTAPAIHVRRGERFAIRIVNDIKSQSPGETVSATALPPCKPMMMADAPLEHWTGYLNHVIDDRPMAMSAMDTNLHLHGFEGPAAMENVFLSTLSTPMHACEYDVTIPTTQPPGMYLYHPHAHGASDLQVGGGLDGAWIVDPDSSVLPDSAQHVLILRYRIPFVNDNNFQLDESALGPAAEKHEGSLLATAPAPYDPFHPPSWPLSFPMHAGNLRLDSTGCNAGASEVLVTVNGADVPAALPVSAGETQLLRVLNGTSDTAERLVLRDEKGAMQPLRVASLDGVPISGDMVQPMAHYLALNNVMLSPMGRADILLDVPAGKTYMLSTEHYCSGVDAFFEMHHDLVAIRGVPNDSPRTALTSTQEPVSQTPAARLVEFARTHRQQIRRRAITFTEYAFPKRGKIPEHQGFFITDTTNLNFHEHSFWPTYSPGATFPAQADIAVKQGSIEEWYLVNTTMETHGFHIHQMAFVQERSSMGVPVTVDTVFVPIGKLLPNRRDPNYPLVKPSITRVLLDFRHVPKGEFVFHCHMLFHEDHGMMGIIRVV